MVTAQDVAEYFIARAIEDDDPISNMKLQKLIYYAQGFHLALFDCVLFADPIEAWQHGPVVPALYHEYKVYGPNPIILDVSLDYDKFDGTTLELLNDVYNLYGQYSAFALRNMTHTEPPWKETPTSGEIPTVAMQAFFKTRINN